MNLNLKAFNEAKMKHCMEIIFHILLLKKLVPHEDLLFKDPIKKRVFKVDSKNESSVQ